MAYTLVTASNAEDLVNEVIDYQIPVLNSAGEIDDSQGPQACGIRSNRTLTAFQDQPLG